MIVLVETLENKVIDMMGQPCHRCSGSGYVITTVNNNVVQTQCEVCQNQSNALPNFTQVVNTTHPHFQARRSFLGRVMGVSSSDSPQTESTLAAETTQTTEEMGAKVDFANPECNHCKGHGAVFEIRDFRSDCECISNILQIEEKIREEIIAFRSNLEDIAIVDETERTKAYFEKDKKVAKYRIKLIDRLISYFEEE